MDKLSESQKGIVLNLFGYFKDLAHVCNKTEEEIHILNEDLHKCLKEATVLKCIEDADAVHKKFLKVVEEKDITEALLEGAYMELHEQRVLNGILLNKLAKTVMGEMDAEIREDILKARIDELTRDLKFSQEKKKNM